MQLVASPHPFTPLPQVEDPYQQAADQESEQGGGGAPTSAPAVHAAFLADCSRAQSWRSIGLLHSHAASGQRGNLTRLLACSAVKQSTAPEGAVMGLWAGAGGAGTATRCPMPVPEDSLPCQFGGPVTLQGCLANLKMPRGWGGMDVGAAIHCDAL